MDLMTAKEMKDFARANDEKIIKYVNMSIERLKKCVEKGRYYSTVEYGGGIDVMSVLRELEELGYKRYTEPVYSGGVLQRTIYFTF